MTGVWSGPWQLYRRHKGEGLRPKQERTERSNVDSESTLVQGIDLKYCLGGIWLGFSQRSVLDFAGEDLIGISPLLASYGTPPRLISMMSNP